jgi:hypothetical protein
MILPLLISCLCKFGRLSSHLCDNIQRLSADERCLSIGVPEFFLRSKASCIDAGDGRLLMLGVRLTALTLFVTAWIAATVAPIIHDPGS